MKTLTGILYLALFCVAAMAQEPGTATMGQNPVAANLALQQYLKSSAENIKPYAGTSYIKGSPYLAEEFSSGMIHWNGEWHEGIDLRYNAYRGTFETRLERGIVMIDPLKNNMDTIKYRDEEFVRKYLKAGKELQVVYLSLLGQQNGYALCKHYLCSFTEPVTDTYVDTDTDVDTDLFHKASPAEFQLEAPVYYVFKGNEHYTVKGSKSLAEIFQIDAKEVKHYLKDKKYRLSREEDLQEAVLYFSSSSIPENSL